LLPYRRRHQLASRTGAGTDRRAMGKHETRTACRDRLHDTAGRPMARCSGWAALAAAPRSAWAP
jgi:hypothetical protein